MPPHSLTLVIPCYNEERTLKACVERCLELQHHGITLELLIVDDCSTDGSRAIAQQLVAQHQEVRLLTHEHNRGKGAALRTGFANATGDFVGIQDADAEYQPLDYLTLLQPLLLDKADVVYGSRYLKQETRRVLYFWHTWMNRALTFASNMFTNLDISDMETCYKLFRRDVIQKISGLLKEDRFGFEPEVTALVAQGRYRVYECAIHYEPRTYEEGKKIGWKDGLRALYCILHYGAPKAPVPMQVLLYLFIGTFCALVNMLAFAVLLSSFSLIVATVTAFVLAAACNYLLCLAILFRHKARWTAVGEVLSYLLTLSIMGSFDYVMTYGLIALGVGPVCSKAVAAVVGFAGNFLFRKYLVF